MVIIIVLIFIIQLFNYENLFCEDAIFSSYAINGANTFIVIKSKVFYIYYQPWPV